MSLILYVFKNIKYMWNVTNNHNVIKKTRRIYCRNTNRSNKRGLSLGRHDCFFYDAYPLHELQRTRLLLFSRSNYQKRLLPLSMVQPNRYEETDSTNFLIKFSPIYLTRIIWIYTTRTRQQQPKLTRKSSLQYCPQITDISSKQMASFSVIYVYFDFCNRQHTEIISWQ